MKSDLIKDLREHWSFIVLIIGLIVAWTTMQIDVKNQGTRIDNIEKKQEVLANQYTDIKVELAKININLEYIKKTVKSN